jgi:hypothetical protein
MPEKRIVVFVHGWSVHHTDTYGELPERLQSEAKAKGLPLDVRHIWLGKYVSFSDAVRMEDLARAFQAALKRELGAELKKKRRFICITHSTGGPVVRHWWHRYYLRKPGSGLCPMSHLIMLAPANFGSALAQLGKSRVGRIKAWFEGMEPGQGVLDWLELGSPEAWELNQEWIEQPKNVMEMNDVFLFVLTGQAIDRKLYDHLNSYTGEAGSDGVVRVAAANLNATLVRLVQEDPTGGTEARLVADGRPKDSARVALALMEGKSHSGKEMGILRSVRDNGEPHPTVAATIQCILVEGQADYDRVSQEFAELTKAVFEKERVETEDRFLLPDSVYFHDAHSMVIFRIHDDYKFSVADFDLTLLGGARGRISPDLLPQGFFVDRQRNRRSAGTLTYYLNHDLMIGCEELKSPQNPSEVVRKKRLGTDTVGLRLVARPGDGLVHYVTATLAAAAKSLADYLKPHQTTLVDVELRRVVHEGAFRLTRDLKRADFAKEALKNPGGTIE